jgi:hypothetical protein
MVSPPAISNPASLDWDEREITLREALEIFAAASESSKSKLEEEFDKLRLDVWLVLILALTIFSRLSMLDDEFERLKLEVWLVLTLALTRLSELSTLEDEFERLKLEV